MAITSLDQLIAAQSQRPTYLKTASRTTVAGFPFSLFDLAGNPGAGTLAIGNTAAGVVPTDTDAGYPVLNAFPASSTGYLSGVQFSSSVACRFSVYDCVFSCGAYAFNADTTLASQPSYAARIPDGSYLNTEIWIEAVTAFTGTPSFQVFYTNQNGTTGRTTSAVAAFSGMAVGRMFYMPLQSGDTGIQKIERVVGTVATAGTFNVHVMRRLWNGRVKINNDGDAHDFLKTGLPVIYDTSALRTIVYTDGTTSGVPEIQFEVAAG